MKYLEKLISQMYLFDFMKSDNYYNIPISERLIYHKKLQKLFKMEDKFINYKLKLFAKKYNSNLELSRYIDEGFKITFIFDKYRYCINQSTELFYLLQILQQRNYTNLIKILDLEIDINTNKFFYVIRNHNPIIDPSFIKNNILVTFISNLVKALYDLEKLGYYHMDVSLDNIVYQVDEDENFNFIITDFDMISSNSKASNHNIRKSVKQLIK